MAYDLPRVSGMRRVGSILADWFVWGVVASVVQIFKPDWGAFIALVLYILADVVLTAFLGQSPGRYVARIRVVRVHGGSRPGLLSALLRTVLIIVSGWLGLFIYLLALRFTGESPKRMWWDAAAGTQLVPASFLPAGDVQ